MVGAIDTIFPTALPLLVFVCPPLIILFEVRSNTFNHVIVVAAKVGSKFSVAFNLLLKLFEVGLRYVLLGVAKVLVAPEVL